MQPATWLLPSVPTIQGNEQRIAKWRYGQIVLHCGEVTRIDARWWPRWGSVWGAMLDRVARTLPEDECRFYYAFPIRSPGFLALLYVHAGEKTSYRTFHQGVLGIERIARLRSANAIVCQVTNERLTESMMHRWGYEKHATHLGDEHYIRRLEFQRNSF